MSGRATARVVRCIVAPALGVSAAALAASTAALVVACNREPGSGPYTGPVGMVPAQVFDAQTPPPPGIVAPASVQPPQPPGALPAPTQALPPPGVVPAPTQHPSSTTASTQPPRPPGMVPAPSRPAIPGMPPLPNPTALPVPAGGSGMLPGAAATALASTQAAPRPVRATRRATDRDDAWRFGALAGRSVAAAAGGSTG